MQLHVIAASNRQPEWVEAGFATYAKRFSGALQLKYTQVRLARGLTGERARADEGRRLLAAAGRNALLIALDEGGRGWTTRALAAELERWQRDAAQPCFVIGGPAGLAPAVREAAAVHWSLSPLTLPHGIARILVAEALYRAASLLAGHPYHRE